jgi:hypothetical protein
MGTDVSEKTAACHFLGGRYTEGRRFFRNVGIHPPNYTASSQKTILEIFTAVRTSNPTSLFHNFSFRIYEAIQFQNKHLHSFLRTTVVQQVNIPDMNKGMKLFRETDKKPAMKKNVQHLYILSS